VLPLDPRVLLPFAARQVDEPETAPRFHPVWIDHLFVDFSIQAGIRPGATEIVCIPLRSFDII
jgi:hypothetical protein